MTPLGRRCAAAAAAVATALALLTAPLSPASAEPSPDEGGDQTLGAVLESSGKRYLEAKAVLDNSKKKQAELQKQLDTAQGALDGLATRVGEMAAEQYRQGRLTGPSLMLASSDPSGFFGRMTSLNELSEHNDARLHEYLDAKDTIARAKSELDAEVDEEQKALSVIDKQKKEAEKALALVGGNVTTKGLVTANSPKAAPAPRTSSGGWPAESCTEQDPTTSGCLTPRTLHAFNEVKKAGFNRFVGCFRTGDIWEHPKGRACDWSLQTKGFSVWDTDDELKYGNDVMAFLVRNANELGILYVIWNRQVWFPATGWSPYVGDSTHEDHVHMSIV
ncbi:coiled-coil domain-containing protein [Catenuloplanes sp. NPDC051500]|uniref:coiled-coil domain-containing protein n=1 Tax=Catenuloplanes sp. NPDC051500 TaxID=3363959 RepID=UPI0037873A80